MNFNKKKIICCCVLFMLAASALHAQPQINNAITAQLSNATVYYGYGAELNHTAKAALHAGLQEIVITNLAANVDVNTIQIGCPENIVLMSYRFAAKTEAKPPILNPALKNMQDSMQVFQKLLNALNNEYAVTDDILSRTTKLIETTLALDGKKEISSAELIKLVDYYTSKVQTLKATLYALSLKRNDVDEKMKSLTTRMNELAVTSSSDAAASKTMGQLILQVTTKAAASADFSISYLTPNAGWLPSYDLRVKTIDNICKLAYKASITQSTGIDWKGVKLTLSTSNPNQSGNVPIIAPWYLNLYVPALYSRLKDAEMKNLAYNKLQNMGAMRETIATSGNGYAQQNADETAEPSNVSAYTNLNQSQLYTNYEIDLPYDIPTDGKAYSVSIKEENVNAAYRHYAVPKYDRDVFLVAQIKDWELLDLLPGDVSIVLDNVYIGKSFIDPNITTDTLNLSLGRDKRIAIKRTLIKELTKSKVHGETKTESFTYEISVKNNKKQASNLVLKDQYPLSKVKEVEITLDNNGGAEVNEEMGTLNWKITLQPGESKKFRFAYSVKYPKDKSIYNLR